MALPVDRFRRIADRARGIPGAMGLRPNTLSVVTRTHSLTRLGDGDTDETALVIETPGGNSYKVRDVSSREVSESGGAYEVGDIVVGPITPAYAGPPAGGYTPEQLRPTVEAGTRGTEIVYVVTGPNAGEYSHVETRVDRSLRYELVLRRRTRP